MDQSRRVLFAQLLKFIRYSSEQRKHVFSGPEDQNCISPRSVFISHGRLIWVNWDGLDSTRLECTLTESLFLVMLALKYCGCSDLVSVFQPLGPNSAPYFARACDFLLDNTF